VEKGASWIPRAGLPSYVVGRSSRADGGGMSINPREEIAASVAAQQTLGPNYDQALAEGLVERIGDEIDQRIMARIDQHLSADPDDQVAPEQGATKLDHHMGCRHVRRAQRRAERRAYHAGKPSPILPLVSLGAAVAATAITLLHNGQMSTPNGGYTQSGPGAMAYLLTALVWIVVGTINVAAYTHKLPWTWDRRPPTR
jgi:hypothetical protein